ncbi:MAG: ABC transporter ATP-binding protein [Planctomycetaceae bacterium]|nr:ABC transporter ATP-binding protein [Planctomycetaceae bacterium]
MIRVVDVTQHYSVKPVLKGINLEFPEGSTTVIIGPNGMGKTTLLSVMAGTLSPQKGYVEINGLVRRSTAEDEIAIRKQCVYLPDRCWLPKEYTGREFLAAVGQLYEIEINRLLGHAERLVKLFNLTEIADSPIRTYSAGQQKKISLCSALITECPILLLDEPFSGGLDPAGIMALKQLLQSFTRDQKRTVVLTTPVPELVAEVADRLVVINQGEVLAEGAITDFVQQAGPGATLADALQTLVFPETTDHLAAYLSEDES